MFLEETDEQSVTIAKWVVADLDQDHLVDTMKELWFFIQSCEKDVDTGKWNQTLFRAYHILRRIADYKGINVDQLSMNLKSNCKDLVSLNVVKALPYLFF